MPDNTHTLGQQNKTESHAEYWNILSPRNRSKTFPCISDAFDYLESIKANENESFNVLITGSLHLIGEVMRTISTDKSDTAK